jgi:SAM-dependent methyltransferase
MSRGGLVPGVPWQLQLFEKSLKKRQKVALLLDLLGRVDGLRALLLTCGDNNGAMNHQFRAAGGEWRWADLEEAGIPEMAALLGEPVEHATPEALPFADGAFDRVVVIDAHEHLTDVRPLNREIARVLRPGGMAVVTTPNGDTRLPVSVLKRLVGMTPEHYGHVVQGYRADELEAMLHEVGLVPERRGAYSRFFTELAELGINFAYVKVLSRNGTSAAPKGTIAPSSSDQLRRVEKSYRMYSRIYPLMRAFSALDSLVPGEGGYAVAVTARKPA